MVQSAGGGISYGLFVASSRDGPSARYWKQPEPNCEHDRYPGQWLWVGNK